MVLGCVLSLLGCSADSDGGGSAGNAGSGAGEGGTAGNAGAGGTSGGTSGQGGTSGTAGNSGTGSTAGSSGSSGSSGNSGAGASGSGGTAAGGNSGTSGAGGESGASGASGAGGDSCGGRGQMECPGGSYCSFPEDADCGRFDAPGTCTALTDVACGEIYSPVCGCDGETYDNPCSAAQAGMSIDHEGECDAPQGGYDCTLSGVACLIAIPECAEGQVPSADGACFGPCVPIEECNCGGPDDCPFPDRYTCWMSAGHCGPYTQ
jgi:hypothetical protein